MATFLEKLEDILLKFYDEIIADVWAVLLIIPVDNALYKFFTGQNSYNLGAYYWIFFGCYTTFFIVSAWLLPIIKKKRIIEIIDGFEEKKKINLSQKSKIINILDDIYCYKTITTKDGFMNFLLEAIYVSSMMFAYFGVEGLISNVLTNTTLIVPVIFIMLFLALLFFESFLDDYIAQQIRSNYKEKKLNTLYSNNKKLIMQLIEDIGGGGSSSEKIGQILLEDTIDDITEIMNIYANKKTKTLRRKVNKIRLMLGKR